jgi:hypothetical protein
VEWLVGERQGAEVGASGRDQRNTPARRCGQHVGGAEVHNELRERCMGWQSRGPRAARASTTRGAADFVLPSAVFPEGARREKGSTAALPLLAPAPPLPLLRRRSPRCVAKSSAPMVNKRG